MKVFKILFTISLSILLCVGLSGCRIVTLDQINNADKRLILLESGLTGDKWVQEDSNGGRQELKACGVPVFERCFNIPFSNQKLRYPVLIGSAEKDATVSRLFWGQDLYCQKPSGSMQPELICAIL